MLFPSFTSTVVYALSLLFILLSFNFSYIISNCWTLGKGWPLSMSNYIGICTSTKPMTAKLVTKPYFSWLHMDHMVTIFSFSWLWWQFQLGITKPCTQLHPAPSTSTHLHPAPSTSTQFILASTQLSTTPPTIFEPKYCT